MRGGWVARVGRAMLDQEQLVVNKWGLFVWMALADGNHPLRSKFASKRL